MSVVSETLSVRRGPLVVAGGVLAAIVVSSLANTVISVLAHEIGAPDDFAPLMPSSYVFLTALGAVLGALGWGIVRKSARNPERLVRWLAPAVVVVSFVPDFLLYGEGGATGVAALLLMHAVVAVILVMTYRKVMPLNSAR
ncbi:DUF6069 family protein [Streptomyces sp. NBC_01390]|uniref:DUF6069 family protein n=1 Tax=Streptomyces sp. NBC_01390 TaxID=2903850 RepID=UPI003252CE03